MGKYWTTEPIWEGWPAVIVAGGPSFTAAQSRLIGIAKARNLIKVVAINDAVYPCWYADIAYACDERWWKYHRGLPGFRGMRVGMEPNGLPSVRILKNGGMDGFSFNPDTLCNGGNSGYQCVHLCAHLGADPIITVALDMDGPHWFGKHPDDISMPPRPVSERVDRFNELADILNDLGVDVINTSPRSSLRCFRMSDLETELKEVERRHGQRGNQGAGGEARAD